MRLLKFVFIIIVLSLLSCNDNNDYIAVKKAIINKEIKLPFNEKGVICINNMQIIEDENGDLLLIVVLYPKNKLYIYNLNDRKLKKTIPFPVNNISLHSFNYINKDSIWLFFLNSHKYSYDSSLMVINDKAIIKYLYPIYHKNILNPRDYPDLYCDTCTGIDKNIFDTIMFCRTSGISDELINNSRVYFYFFGGNIGEKYPYKKLPIFGYYDIKNKELVVNEKIWYPYHKDSVFYESSRYSSSFVTQSHKNTELLTFSYTPAIYEWDRDIKTVKIHRIASQLIDTIYPLKRPGDSYIYLDTTDIYGSIEYVPFLKMYVRYASLPKDKYNTAILLIFTDTLFNYQGEAIFENDSILPRGVYKDNFYNAFIEGDSIVLRFFNYEFEKFDIKKLKKKRDSIKVKKIDEYCKITGQSNIEYSEEKFINYVRNFGIEDTSFALVILSKKGCYGCNDIITINLSYNQALLCDQKDKPFYLLYIDEKNSKKNSKKYLESKNIRINDHIKIDTTSLYHFFNPQGIENPRLVLVRNNKVELDSTYMPNSTMQLMIDMMNYYEFTAE